MSIYRRRTINGLSQWVKITIPFVPPPTGTGLLTSATRPTTTTLATKG